MKCFLSAALLGSVLLGFTACDKNDDTNNSYDIPETYNFENVDYSGQKQRLDMLAELSTYAKKANALNGPVLDAQKMRDMYSNSNTPFTNADLNASTKQLKNKTTANMQSEFDAYINTLASVSLNTGVVAANGRPGIATTNAGKSYLLNSRGLEWIQVIEKGLMGACFYYQGTAVYLGNGKMGADNKEVTPGKGTAMEHHWDEGFGYFGVPKNFPQDKTGIRYWGKYVNKHENVYPLNKRVMNAFLKGRAAISNKDLDTRDEAIQEVRKEWELVVVATSIYYLNNAKENLGVDDAARAHQLSEAFGFISSIKWGAGTGTTTGAQIDAILTGLFGSADPRMANVYAVDAAKIKAAKTALTGYYTDLASVKDQL